MDCSIDGRFEPSRKRGGALRPFRQTAYARSAPDMLPRRGTARHKIGTVAPDALRHIGKSMGAPGINIVRLRVDKAHRYSGNHVLERGTPPQGDGACPQLQPEIYQRAEQQQ